MAYVIDVVKSLVTSISTVEPVLFQRDGALYIVTPEAFGQVTHGLEINPRGGRTSEASLAATNLLVEHDSSDEESAFLEGEQERLAPITLSGDATTFTLEDVLKSAKKLCAMPRDGKIRIIGHDSRYHSHKYGYAADGIDVWLAFARSMDINLYTALMKKQEDAMIGQLINLQAVNPRARDAEYCRMPVPEGFVMTSSFLLTFPRKGSVRERRDTPAWTMLTELGDGNTGTIWRRDVDSNKEHPYGAYVTINAFECGGSSLALHDALGSHGLTTMKSCLVIDDALAAIENIADRLNGIHQRICADSIEFRKSLRREPIV